MVTRGVDVCRWRNRLPKSTIFMVGLLTVICIVPFAGLGSDNSLTAWFPKGAPALANYLDRKTTFGEDLSIHVIYRHPELFSDAQVSLIRQLSGEIAELPHVDAVNSITTIEVTRFTPFGVVQINLLDERGADMVQAAQYLIGDPLYADRLVSSDGTATAIEIVIDEITDEQRPILVDQVAAIFTQDAYQDKDFFLIGGMPLITEMDRISRQESSRFLLGAVIVIYLILAWTLASALYALIPLLVSSVAMIWTMAIFALTGNSINMVTSIIPLVILVLSIANSVHILHRYNSARASGTESAPAIISAVRTIFVPCLFTSLTTAFALLAFVTSSIPPLQAFGFYSALGVMISFAMSVILLPAMLRCQRRSKISPPGRSKTSPLNVMRYAVLGGCPGSP